jgi:uncharacterized membrane protein (UPF0182 family)
VRRRRRRGALIPTLIGLAALVVFVLIVDSIWTDALWYGQLGYVSVYRTQLLTQVLLFILGALVMGGAVFATLAVAYRSRPVYVPVASDQSSIERYRDAIEPLRRVIVLAVPAVLGLFAGSAVSQQWQTVLMWWNGTSFGHKDPQFGLDVGFFVFTLPFVEFLVGFFTAVVVLSGIAAVVAHYLYGGLRLQGPGPRLTSAARIHLFVLAAIFLFLRAVDYWLGRYDLAISNSGRFTGLNYTGAHATVTARGILAGIALIVAALFIVGALVDGWWRMLPLYGVVGLIVSAIIIGGIVPAVVQRFQVTPSAQTLERPYFQRNIDATRAAYGLDGVEVQQYSGQPSGGASAATKAADTAKPGIRLFDPSVVSDAFKQQQQISQYYQFADSLDVDRYAFGGVSHDSVVAVRELNQDGLGTDQRNWYNDHIVYTHGIGLVAAYGNQPGSNGNPDFYEKNIPPSGPIGPFQPRVYFGENSPDYSIVGGPSNGAQRELDYPNSSNLRQQDYAYQGTGGVDVGSPMNKLLYTIKFREQNILLSDAVTAQSRIMYDRSPRDRVEKVAPYLTLDGDPYPSVVDGKIVWILDGYTTTNQYPYSQNTSLRDVTSDSLTQTKTSVVALDAQDINYIRNSVKATVDAFTGAVTLYAWDPQDPILRTWMRIFPGTVKPLADMSGSVMSHVRYPEDLFKVQRTVLGRYHVTDANAFFGGQDFWQVPADPTDSEAAALQPPFYLSLQMPGHDARAFSLTSTFIPQSSGTSTRNVLTGFLAVDSDAGPQAGQPGGDYGHLRLLQLPKDTTVPAPGQVQANFSGDSVVSNQLNILAGGRTGSGSRLEYGNLLTLPLAGGLLYVEPIYLRSSVGSTSVPLLQKVLVWYGNSVGYADGLDCALDQAINDRGAGNTSSEACTGDSGANATTGQGAGNGEGTGTATNSPTTTTSPTTGTQQTAQQQLQQALADANKAYQNGQDALRKGNFAAYGVAQQKLADALNRATQAEQRLGSSPSPGSPRPSSTG